jgi:hypothetical protein
MGSVIRFPDEKRMTFAGARPQDGPAAVVILPVVRIERHGEEPNGAAPDAGTPRGPTRRGRSRRS